MAGTVRFLVIAIAVIGMMGILSPPLGISPGLLQPVPVNWGGSRTVVEMAGMFAPSLLVMASGEIWLFFNAENNGMSVIYLMTRNNGTWSAPAQLTDGTRNDWDPHAIRYQDGHVRLFFSRSMNLSSRFRWIDCHIHEMEYDGRNWSAPRQVTDQVSPERPHTGEIWPVPFAGPDGRVHLVFEHVTGITENLDDVMIMNLDGAGWGPPSHVCTGNTPTALEDSTGAIHVFSNLITYTSGPQDSVDEHVLTADGWEPRTIEHVAHDSCSVISALNDGKGLTFLFYDDEAGRTTRVLMQTRTGNAHWSVPATVIGRGAYPAAALTGNDEILLVYSNSDGQNLGSALYEKVGKL